MRRLRIGDGGGIDTHIHFRTCACVYASMHPCSDRIYILLYQNDDDDDDDQCSRNAQVNAVKQEQQKTGKFTVTKKIKLKMLQL